MERNWKRIGLVNLLFLLAVGATALAVARYTQTLAGHVAVVFLGLGALVAAVSWFQMRLEELERLERLELDELARSRGGTIFERDEAELFPARRTREQFERYVVPVVAVLLFLGEVAAVILFWRWLDGLPPAARLLKSPLPAMAFFAGFFLVLFLLGKYTAGVARLERQRLLRPGAGYLLLGAYLCLLATAGIVAVQVGFPKVDLVLARALCVLLGLIAAESLITLILEIYRPRVRGMEVRPLYESRLVGLLSQPEGLVTTLAQAIDYQFGFKVSETWAYQTLVEKLPRVALGLVAALLASTCVVILEPGEQALLERFGRPVAGRAVLGPGPHLKWPWPVDKVWRFPTRELQSFVLGAVAEEQERKEHRVLQWTVSHYREEFNFLVASREALPSGPTAPREEERAVPVNLISAAVPVQFYITNVLEWGYNYADARALLEQLATRELVRYLAGVDLLDIMSVDRGAAGEQLRQRLQASATALGLGVEIMFVGLQDIHPPVKVADAFEAVNSAQQEIEAKILKAQGEASRTTLLARAESQEKVREAEAWALTYTAAANAQAARFRYQLMANAVAPSVYQQRLYLQTLAEGAGRARKYVLGPTNIQDVFQFNLEDRLPELFERIAVPPAKK